LVHAGKTDHKITDEFMVAREKLIGLLNAGSVSLRCKGSKRVQIQEALKAARSRLLMIIRGRDTVNKTKYHVMTVDRYRSLKGQDPKEAGEETLWTTRAGKRVEIVLLRLHHEDEWDLEVNDYEGIQMQTTYDNGENEIRENQLDVKAQQLGDRFQQAAFVKAGTIADFEKEDVPAPAEKGIEKEHWEFCSCVDEGTHLMIRLTAFGHQEFL
jgi:hypothetical protein